MIGVFPFKATLWTRGSRTGYGGFSFNAPKILDVRWETRAELFTNEAGESQMSRARVFLKEDVSIGDWLALGEFSAASPVNSAYEVKDFRKIPDIRGTQYERRALL